MKKNFEHQNRLFFSRTTRDHCGLLLTVLTASMLITQLSGSLTLPVRAESGAGDIVYEEPEYEEPTENPESENVDDGQQEDHEEASSADADTGSSVISANPDASDNGSSYTSTEDSENKDSSASAVSDASTETSSEEKDPFSELASSASSVKDAENSEAADSAASAVSATSAVSAASAEEAVEEEKAEGLKGKTAENPKEANSVPKNTFSEVSNAEIQAELDRMNEELHKTDPYHSYVIVDKRDVSVAEGELTEETHIEFDANTGDTGNVSLLHFTDGDFEHIVPEKVEGDSIVAEFSSLSPVIVIEKIATEPVEEVPANTGYTLDVVVNDAAASKALQGVRFTLNRKSDGVALADANGNTVGTSDAKVVTYENVPVDKTVGSEYSLNLINIKDFAAALSAVSIGVKLSVDSSGVVTPAITGISDSTNVVTATATASAGGKHATLTVNIKKDEAAKATATVVITNQDTDKNSAYSGAQYEIGVLVPNAGGKDVFQQPEGQSNPITVNTDASGKGVYTNLTAGVEYYFIEKTTAPGLIPKNGDNSSAERKALNVDGKTVWVQKIGKISAGETKEVVSTNTPISITFKHADSSAIDRELTVTAGTKSETVVFPKEGKTILGTKDLFWSAKTVYTVTEKNTPSGYKPIQFMFAIDSDGEVTPYSNADARYASVVISKKTITITDEKESSTDTQTLTPVLFKRETGKYPGTRFFKITNAAEGLAETLTVAVASDGTAVKLLSADGKDFCKTNSEYVVSEVNDATYNEKYTPVSQFTFTVDSNGKTQVDSSVSEHVKSKEHTITFSDVEKSAYTIKISFKLFLEKDTGTRAETDIPLNNVNFSISKDGKKIDPSSGSIDTFKGIEGGKYTLTITKPKNPYIEFEDYSQTLEVKKSETLTIKATLSDDCYSGNIRFETRDRSDLGKRVEGATFKIARPKFTAADANSVNMYDIFTTSKTSNVAFEATSDSQGIVVKPDDIKMLKVGRFYSVTVSKVPDGYDTKTSSAKTVKYDSIMSTFSVDDDEKNIFVIDPNADNFWYLSDTGYTLKITATDPKETSTVAANSWEDRAKEGAKLQLVLVKNDEETVIDTWTETTHEIKGYTSNGTKLEKGNKYIVRETNTPSGKIAFASEEIVLTGNVAKSLKYPNSTSNKSSSGKNSNASNGASNKPSTTGNGTASGTGSASNPSGTGSASSNPSGTASGSNSGSRSSGSRSGSRSAQTSDASRFPLGYMTMVVALMAFAMLYERPKLTEEEKRRVRAWAGK